MAYLLSFQRKNEKKIVFGLVLFHVNASIGRLESFDFERVTNQIEK